MLINMDRDARIARGEIPAKRAGVVNGEGEQRYGFVVFTGRHKILDYYKPDGQQIATADNEESARKIVRVLNAAENHASLVAALEKAQSALRDIERETKAAEHGLSFPLTLQEIDAALSRVRE